MNDPLYKVGDTITDGNVKGKIHKVSTNANGYVYCIWREDRFGRIIGLTCIEESEIKPTS